MDTPVSPSPWSRFDLGHRFDLAADQHVREIINDLRGGCLIRLLTLSTKDPKAARRELRLVAKLSRRTRATGRRTRNPAPRMLASLRGRCEARPSTRRTATRSSARSGDSGDDPPGEPPRHSPLALRRRS